MPTIPALETRALSKSYGPLVAVDRASITVLPGEVVGFVGPNGAGKSTLMKMILGIVRPTSGEARVFEHDLRTEPLAARRRIGYLPGDLGLYPALSGRALIDFLLAFHPHADPARVVELARRLDVPLDRRVKACSSGMRQKLGVIAALCAGADLLVLDEPTRGLDPTSQVIFLDLISEARAAGASVFLSSHILEEIARACDRIVFIDGGRLIDDAAIERVLDRFRSEMKVTFRGPLTADLATLPGVVRAKDERTHWQLQIDGPLEPLLAALARQPIDSIEYNRPGLADLYRALYLDRRTGDRT